MAAKNEVQYRVVFNKFPEVSRRLKRKAGEVVATTALNLQADAQTRAPVDTGTLRASIQAVKVTRTHYRVTVGAEYGIYVEHGTRFMGARPYFRPAVNRARRAFSKAMRGVLQ